MLTKPQLQKENDILRLQLKERTQENTQMRDNLRKVQDGIAKAYTTPQLLSNVMNDQELVSILS